MYNDVNSTMLIIQTVLHISLQPEEVVTTVAIEATHNVTEVLAELPIETQQKLGHSLESMLQDCKWLGQNCGPR